jgi:radical SAM protein with 4Fe4S-binding SPASM domain
MKLSGWLRLAAKGITARKIFNTFAIVASYVLSRVSRRPFAWGMPPVVMIEPTNYCNLKCPLCPSGNGTLRRDRGFMDPTLFRRLVDEVRRDTWLMLLWNQGESFIHKEFLDMVRYVSDAGIWTISSTNGHFLSDPEAVVKSGLDSMIISLDGATAETYQQYRVGGDFDKVIDGIRGLVEAKKRLGSFTPIIQLQFILFKHNEHEVDEVRRIAAELGVDKVTYKTAQIYNEDDVDQFLPEHEEYRRYDVDDAHHFEMRDGHRGVPNTCRTLWWQPVLNYDGTVTPCCADKHGEFVLGDMSDGTSFREIWNGRTFNGFRKRVLTNRAGIEICRNCTEGIRVNFSTEGTRVK